MLIVFNAPPSHVWSFRWQISYEEALAGGVLDRLSSSFVDKRSGTTVSCNKALDVGLIEIVGDEVCHNLSLPDSIAAYQQYR